MPRTRETQLTKDQKRQIKEARDCCQNRLGYDAKTTRDVMRRVRRIVVTGEAVGHAF